MQRKLDHRAFTLLEMLAVITIIGIIASIVVSRVSYQALEAKKKCCLQYKGDINSALEHYHFDTGSYPTSVDDLQGKYYPDVLPKCPITKLGYDIDAATGRVVDHAH